jgi:pyridoxamine 5'-phosphate oxidase
MALSDPTERTSPLMLESLRETYRRASLSERDCETNPIHQFERWFRDAQAAEIKEPNAMTLATVGADGRPSARIVLLKGLDSGGFVFYTNQRSRKGREMEANPFVALTFLWAELERQVRVEGEVGRVSRTKGEIYWRGRPKGSRLGAWVSRQSEIIPDRKVLEVRLLDLQARYADTDDVPMPEFWGGYVVRPEQIEFWQGRPDRLHDRLLYRTNGEDAWTLERLAP